MSSFRKGFIVTPTQILVRKHLKQSSDDTNYKRKSDFFRFIVLFLRNITSSRFEVFCRKGVL